MIDQNICFCYLGGMQSFHILPPGQLYLIPRENTFDLTIELALNGGLRLLICGNRLPFYDIAYELAWRVGHEYERILKEGISFSRAETCTQLMDFLSEMDAQTTPLLATDLLSRFYAEDDHQVDELFFKCQIELRRLSQDCLVFVSANPKPPLERLGHVLDRITRQLDYSHTINQKGKHNGPHTTPLLPSI
jgi:hypothetical protein